MNLEYTEKIITPEMRFVGVKLELAEYNVYTEREIKEMLSRELAKFILDKDLCEFTRYKEPTTWSTVFNARVFISSKQDVRLIRMSYK